MYLTTTYPPLNPAFILLFVIFKIEPVKNFAHDTISNSFIAAKAQLQIFTHQINQIILLYYLCVLLKCSSGILCYFVSLDFNTVGTFANILSMHSQYFSLPQHAWHPSYATGKTDVNINWQNENKMSKWRTYTLDSVALHWFFSAGQGGNTWACMGHNFTTSSVQKLFAQLTTHLFYLAFHFVSTYNIVLLLVSYILLFAVYLVTIQQRVNLQYNQKRRLYTVTTTARIAICCQKQWRPRAHPILMADTVTTTHVTRPCISSYYVRVKSIIRWRNKNGWQIKQNSILLKADFKRLRVIGFSALPTKLHKVKLLIRRLTCWSSNHGVFLTILSSFCHITRHVQCDNRWKINDLQQYVPIFFNNKKDRKPHA